ncbi:lipase 3-like [Cataglyphis hispanica]|uniref:lipase 3-like n=1 Tax=Cataglyphis hispanica TaxID=1086592 RepID=UPI00217F63E3|nr:lipase 3-like [Cataglyphis hispanica]XP_050450443.1 lipase 3-like [Cataglyphis hispanica]XP_050450444.1 lipase 3-like [Cataglyphis hispanica]XP_050450445.1 lipase 3-like [Cataglyphis hispanica]
MIAYWCFVSLLYYGFIVQTNGLFRTRGIFPPLKDPNLLVEDIVRQNGYPFELHHVTTRDGYILAMHRIPSKNMNNNMQNQRVVLVMHGLLGCSADWLVTGNRSIAYLLSDNGYDVWLGNSRGTTNSKNHTRLSVESAQFWDFSWHEMGIYDLPVMIDYILCKTGQKQLFYIGFSQGTTQFWVLMSLKPEYNRKIKLMTALAPVAYTGHIGGALRPLSFFGNFFVPYFKYIGFFELLSNTDMEKIMARTFCREGMMTQPICEFVISSIGGFSDSEMDRTRLDEYLQFAPAGCSFKQLLHYSMGIQNPGRFRSYDYGILTNLLVYRRIEPPEYPVERITAPVIFYNGLNDVLAHPNDVEILQRKLPNLLGKYTVQSKPLGHFDFVYGKSIRDLVYNDLIEKMNSIP